MALGVHQNKAVLQRPQFCHIGARLLDPGVTLRAGQCGFVGFKSVPRAPFRWRSPDPTHRGHTSRRGQAGKFAADFIEAGIQINERLARDDAAEDFPGPGEGCLGTRIQRVEAIPKIP